MKKLKIILQSNCLLIIFFLLTTATLYIRYKAPLYDEDKLGKQEIIGMIRNIEVGEYNTKITVGSTLITVEDVSFQLGEKVRCQGEVTVPNGQRNFYLFDYQKYLASKNIFYFMQGECEVISTSIPIFYRIKNNMITRIESRKSSPYLKTFLLGNSRDIRDDVRKSYQINGISHLFSVSGMHIGFFFLLFEYFIKNEKKRNLFLFIFLLFYLFLTNYSPSVIRASLFFFFSKGAKRLGFTTVQSYLFFTMLILLYQPYFLYHTGFLYSFTISFFLILFSPYLKNEKNYWKGLFKISFLSILSSIPIQIQSNFSLNFFSLGYNLIFVPIVSNLLFPCSFIVFFFSIFDSFYFFLLMILENLSLFLANIPSTLIFCHLPMLGVIIYYVILLFVMHKMMKREYKYSVVLVVFFILHFIFPRLNPNGMVLMMDVGQGDSILIVYPHQKLTILVDTGGAYYDTAMAENTIIPTLYAHGITSLDYVILSHGDLDHVGEALSLLKNIKVKNVLLNSGADGKEEQKIITYLKTKGISYQKISQDIITNKEEKLYFLNRGTSSDENEDSLVCYLTVHGFSILLMGDSGNKTEQEILKEYNLSSVDILKVGHHGSRYSTSEDFLSRINPSTCLISAGVDNRYGHPHKETIRKLQFCDTYITSIDGAIKVTLGKSMHVITVR